MLRHVMRRWRRRPGLAVVAVLVLSLGIGATTAMFSLIDAVLLADEPWPEADRLVRIYGVQPGQRSNPAAASTWNRGGIAWQSWRQLQELPHFDDVVAWVPGDQIVGDERTELVRAFFASSTLPHLVGARPALGRFFTASEDEADPQTVVISHGVWMRLFGGDPDVIGRVTSVTPPGGTVAPGRRRTIVGVLPEGFTFPGGTPDILIPLGFHQYNGSFGTPFFSAMGRLAREASTSAAANAIEPLVRRDQTPEQRTSRLVLLRDERLGVGGDRPLWLMLAGASLLLVVACANVAGLLLSDARSRHHETAVRLSLGGTRFEIVRQLMAEHLALGIAAAAGGVLFARWLIPVLISLAPAGLVGAQPVGVDREVIQWSVLAALATATIAGIIPAMAIASAPPADALKSGTRQTGAGGRWRHRTIVAAQFGLALVLLVGAALFGETLLRLHREPLGFAPDRVAVVSVTRDRAAAGGTMTPAQRQQFAELRQSRRGEELSRFMQQVTWVPVQTLLDRLAALPTVEAVAAAQTVPFTATPAGSAAVRADSDPANSAHPAFLYAASTDYFRAMGVAVRRGRTFDVSVGTPADGVVISESLARRLLPGDPIGRRIVVGKSPAQVIGVVADVKTRGLLDEDDAAVYLPIGSPESIRYIVVRVSGDVVPLLSVLRATVEQHDRPMFVTASTPLSDLVASTIVVERSRALLSAAYGGAALLLASVGLYGLAARLVADRRREIGIRVALGASRRHIRRLVMSDAWTIVGVGLIVGVPLAFWLSRFAQGMLYGVVPAAPHVLAASVLSLAIAAIAATLLPVWRANRIDPAVTLREA
jgi:predicted permease